MKIFKKDLKKGVIKLTPQTQDDLWYLSQVVEQGDLVRGKAERKVKLGESDEKSRSVRKTFTATIAAEKVEYEPALHSLRISGTIAEETTDAPAGSYQSLLAELGSTLSITKKQWLSFHLNRLSEAEKGDNKTILIVVHDREEAYIAQIKPAGYDILAHVDGQVQKKADVAQSSTDFYQQLREIIAEYYKRLSPHIIIVASPAFFAEDFIKSITTEDLKKIIVKATCSSVSINAIDEVMRRDETKNVLAEQIIAKETRAIDDLFGRIATQDKVSYGIHATTAAVESGASEFLLLTNDFIKDQRGAGNGEKIDVLMRKTDQAKGNILIVSSKGAPGKKLDGLGGIAALLRYNIA